PITTPLTEQLVLDNSNIQESYCGATTELTFGFARKAYQTVYTQTMRAVGLKEKTIEANREVVSNLLYKYRGNIYYNINNWYRGLQLLPAFRQNKADMERMMGLEEPVGFVESSSDSFWRIIAKVPLLAINMLRLLRSFRRLKRDTVIFQTHFNSEFEAFYAARPAKFSLNECRAWYDRLNKKLLERWHVPIVNDFFVMMQNGKVHRQLKKARVENPDAWLKTRLIGDESLPSLQPAIELEKLGRKLRKDEKLVELIIQFPPDLHEQISEKFPDAYHDIEEYIHHYGDRTIGELKLETTTMRVEPTVFYKYVQNYLHAENGIEAKPSKVQNEAAEVRNLKKLREGIYRREALRLERTKLFGMYRSLFLRVGTLLQAQEQPEKPEDIFHLTLDEAEAVLRGEGPPSITKLTERKAELETYRNAEIPSRVYLPGRERRVTTGQSEDGSWHGEPAVPGFAEGEVVCIREPGEWTDLRGKIICALRTDPGWAPLFPGCRGVLIEKGSSLSHSVIMLRELGIPTIINLPGISAHLESGTLIEMDAELGKITIKS
ncbi:MAG TPA: PEP-utilizing enzyme, partial [Cryomorphaceae bacterium]|nr:PEP-utilizing enzyme [Cryomorphaceae bacterium]